MFKMLEKASIWNLLMLFQLVDFFIVSRISGISIYLHDIVFVVFIICLIIFDNAKVKFNLRVIFFTGIYFLYSFIVTSFLIIMGTKLTYISYLYIIKEIIYITVFFIITRSFNSNFRVSSKILIALIAVNIVYGVYLTISGNIAHYGIGSIITTSPSQCGIIYFTCMVISLIYFVNTQKRLYLILTLISIVLTALTISRTSIIGVLVFFSIYIFTKMLLSINKRFQLRKLKYNIYIILASVALIICFINFNNNSFENNLVQRIMNRMGYISKSVTTRMDISKSYYSNIIGDSTIKLLFGQGKAIPEITQNKDTLGVDNQFVRLIIETGIIGSLLWIIMIFNWIMHLIKRLEVKNSIILLSFVGAFFVMGLGYEVFQVTKAGISFWLILAILYSYNNKRLLE